SEQPGQRAEPAAAQVVEETPAAAPGESKLAEPPAEHSIAVLPFTVMTNGADDEYFADGLTEEILNSLAQLPELLVTARTSAFAFKGQDLSIQDIALKLGVRNVVEGSVRRSGNRLRVTAQLIRASDGFHLWSENYDSTAEDTIAVQEDIAEKIAEAMNVVLDDEKREAMRQAGLRDVEAFIALQKGIQLYEAAHGAPDMLAKLREANGYFEVVQQRVPDYAPAYLLHSDQYIHLLMSDATGQSLEGALAEDVAAAMSRAEQDTAAGVAKSKNEDARSNAELDLAFISSDWQGMPARIERFLAQSGCEEITWVSNIGSLTGYAQRLIPRDEEYLSCDPLSSSSWRFLVRDNLWAGNPAGALEVARQGEQRAPGSWLGLQMVSALVALGDFDAADQVATATFHNDEDIAITHMMVAAARGDRETAERMLEEFLAGPLADHYWG
ncbi:MAG: hypothetical protein ACREO9_07335, partial [Lysobacterales bacterium]